MSHTVRRRTLVALSGVLLVLAAGCASTGYHWSQLVGQRYFRAPIDTYDVSIVSIDGKSTPFFKTQLVEPGRRALGVQGPPGGAGGIGEVRSVALDIAPCTRYFLVAHKTQPLASDFTVRIDHTEPVAGCTPPS